MKLIVSNKTTSPWPFRAWLALRFFDIPFELDVLDLKLPNKAERLKAASPSGRLPILIDGDIQVWESLAIIEYAADQFPEKNIWPKNAARRAYARAIANEMHAGFAALRKACIFNMDKAPEAAELDTSAQADLARVVELWTQTRQRFAGEGPFLLGEFCAADAMYAPIVSRLHTHKIPVPAEVRKYMETMMALPAWVEWAKGD